MSKRVTAEKPHSLFNHRPSGSYVNAVKDTNSPLIFNHPGSGSPALVLDDSCVNNHDKANSTGESDDEGVSDTIFGDKSQSPCHDRHDENVQETTQHSEDPFVGNSSGILCVWEDSIFKKDNVSISDNFIALYGTWLPTNSKILIVVIYALQCFTLKRHLWEYISGIINRWKGETIVLGYFNEVRCEEERFGFIFHQSYAREFNQFISSSGLMKVKMEGYAFTWTHPSATKSKLDQFLVSEGIIATFPS
nr:RNA-directed DNA polymerase, eukaryota [Tanacetum cinerariifolium]